MLLVLAAAASNEASRGGLHLPKAAQYHRGAEKSDVFEFSKGWTRHRI
jgi:hypothetical protein